MRILIISQYFHPDITAAANRITETADTLSKKGHEVCVVTSTPHKSDADEGGFFLQGVGIERVRVEKLRKSDLSAYLRQFLGFSYGAFNAAWRIRKRFDYDVIWITSPPLTVTLSSLALRLLTRKPVVLDVRDIWPESAVNVGKLKSGGMLERFGKILEFFSYRHASEITCVSRDMADYLRSKSSRPVCVVYNGVLENSIRPFSPDGDPDLFCYAGNLGLAQGLEPMLRGFVKSLESSDMTNARLLLIGDGVLRPDIEKIVERSSIAARVEFTGALPKTEAIERMRTAGTMLIPLMRASAFERTVPSKVFDCLSLGRPILSSVHGEARAILQQTGANVLLENDDADGYSAGFIEARRNWDTLSRLAQKNIDVVRRTYTREQAVSVLEEALERSVAPEATARRQA
jgi:glycosyltransferase involved in cell wall biosynthesis